MKYLDKTGLTYVWTLLKEKLNGKVSSTDVLTIVKLTQDEYDALTSVDDSTLYIIVVDAPTITGVTDGQIISLADGLPTIQITDADLSKVTITSDNSSYTVEESGNITVTLIMAGQIYSDGEYGILWYYTVDSNSYTEFEIFGETQTITAINSSGNKISVTITFEDFG